MKVAKLNINDKVWFVNCRTNGLYEIEYGEVWDLGIFHKTWQYEHDINPEILYHTGEGCIGVFTDYSLAKKSVEKFFNSLIDIHERQVRLYKEMKNNAIKQLNNTRQ